MESEKKKSKMQKKFLTKVFTEEPSQPNPMRSPRVVRPSLSSKMCQECAKSEEVKAFYQEGERLRNHEQQEKRLSPASVHQLRRGVVSSSKKESTQETRKTPMTDMERRFLIAQHSARKLEKRN